MSRSLLGYPNYQYKAKVSSIIHYDTLRSPQITRRVEYSDDEWQLEVSKKFSSTNFGYGTNMEACITITLRQLNVFCHWPTGTIYEIRFMGTEKNDYVSRRGYITENVESKICMTTCSPSFAYLTSKGFIDSSGLLKIELDILVKDIGEEPNGKTADFFTSESTFVSDCVLVVQNKPIHVAKKFLSKHSAVFKAMFESGFKEQDQAEIPLWDVDFNEFIEMLSFIYPLNQIVTPSNVECLLKMSDQFEVSALTVTCKEFLFADESMSNIEKLWLAQNYRLLDLQNDLIDEYKCLDEIHKIETELHYELLNDSTKLKMFQSVLDATRKDNAEM